MDNDREIDEESALSRLIGGGTYENDDKPCRLADTPTDGGLHGSLLDDTASAPTGPGYRNLATDDAEILTPRISLTRDTSPTPVGEATVPSAIDGADGKDEAEIDNGDRAIYARLAQPELVELVLQRDREMQRTRLESLQNQIRNVEEIERNRRRGQPDPGWPLSPSESPPSYGRHGDNEYLASPRSSVSVSGGSSKSRLSISNGGQSKETTTTTTTTGSKMFAVKRPKSWRFEDFTLWQGLGGIARPGPGEPLPFRSADHPQARSFLCDALPARACELDIELRLLAAKRAFRARRFELTERLAHDAVAAVAASFADSYPPLRARCYFYIALAKYHLLATATTAAATADGDADTRAALDCFRLAEPCVAAYPEGDYVQMYLQLCESRLEPGARARFQEAAEESRRTRERYAELVARSMQWGGTAEEEAESGSPRETHASTGRTLADEMDEGLSPDQDGGFVSPTIGLHY